MLSTQLPRLNGFLLVDKPVGPTSFQIVAHVRFLLGGKKSHLRVGHAGTLDPRASGLLILGVGQATKLLSKLIGLDKTYETTVCLGATTATDDAETEPIPWPGTQAPSYEAINRALKEFTGEHLQAPPKYSAKKQHGVRLYKLARQGKTIELRKHPVTIYRIDLLSYRYPLLKLMINCSSGTYIRSFARDLGTALDVGGYVKELRRINIGPFDIKEASAVEGLKLQDELLQSDEVLRRIDSTIPVTRVYLVKWYRP